MNEINNSKKKIASYFVDEAGDLTLFNKKGKNIVGTEGVSKIFIVGVAWVKSPYLVDSKLEDLRKELLMNPFFNKVPSMQSSSKKTAIFFHAKDDLPEIRWEVFKLLKSLNNKVIVAVRRKTALAQFSSQFFSIYQEKISENEIYDELVMRIFRNLLHKADENIIYFAKRGKSERTDALERAIRKAKNNFEIKFGKESNKPVQIIPSNPSNFAGLQVVDYYLWALQRLYEKNEDRFFNFLSEDYKLIMDLDDKRNHDYGEWYSKSNPLELKKIKPVTG